MTEPLRTLVVDNNPTFLNVAREYLQAHVEEVVVIGTATSAREALKETSNLNPDLILLDLHMPDRSGLEIIPELRQLKPGVAIIAVSMLDATNYQPAAIAAGASDFVAKASMVEKLFPAIQRIRLKRQQILMQWAAGG